MHTCIHWLVVYTLPTTISTCCGVCSIHTGVWWIHLHLPQYLLVDGIPTTGWYTYIHQYLLVVGTPSCGWYTHIHQYLLVGGCIHAYTGRWCIHYLPSTSECRDIVVMHYSMLVYLPHTHYTYTYHRMVGVWYTLYTHISSLWMVYLRILRIQGIPQDG